MVGASNQIKEINLQIESVNNEIQALYEKITSLEMKKDDLIKWKNRIERSDLDEKTSEREYRKIIIRNKILNIIDQISEMDQKSTTGRILKSVKIDFPHINASTYRYHLMKMRVDGLIEKIGKNWIRKNPKI